MQVWDVINDVQVWDVINDVQVWDVINEGCPYFYLELPDGTKLFTRQTKGFPLQFAREVS